MNGMKSLFVCLVIGLVDFVIAAPVPAQVRGGGAQKTTPKADQPAKEKSVLADRANRAKPEIAAADLCRCVGQDDSAVVARIEEALRAPLRSTGLSFTDQPLQDVVSQLQDEYGIPIQIDKNALEEAGIGTDNPVTISVHNIALRSALRLMLKQQQLTYTIHNEVLLITTQESAEAELKVCVYDVRKVLGENAPLEPLVDTIISCVAKHTWAKNGKGVAEIRPMKPGLLVIMQTQAVHDEIGKLLTTLRSMSQGRPPAAGAAAGKAVQNDRVVTRAYLLQLNPAKDNETMRKQVRELITKSLPDETWNGTREGQAVVLDVFHDRVVLRHTQEVQEKVRKILADSGVASPAPQTSSDLFGSPDPAATFAPEAAVVPGAVPALAPVPAPAPEGEAPAEVAPGVTPDPNAEGENPFG